MSTFHHRFNLLFNTALIIAIETVNSQPIPNSPEPVPGPTEEEERWRVILPVIIATCTMGPLAVAAIIVQILTLTRIWKTPAQKQAEIAEAIRSGAAAVRNGRIVFLSEPQSPQPRLSEILQ
jgi:hypothetical protein